MISQELHLLRANIQSYFNRGPVGMSHMGGWSGQDGVAAMEAGQERMQRVGVVQPGQLNGFRPVAGLQSTSPMSEVGPTERSFVRACCLYRHSQTLRLGGLLKFVCVLDVISRASAPVQSVTFLADFVLSAEITSSSMHFHSSRHGFLWTIWVREHTRMACVRASYHL